MLRRRPRRPRRRTSYGGSQQKAGGESASSIVDQVLEPLRRQAQCGRIHGLALALRISCQYRLEDIVDFLFDLRELGFAAWLYRHAQAEATAIVSA